MQASLPRWDVWPYSPRVPQGRLSTSGQPLCGVVSLLHAGASACLQAASMPREARWPACHLTWCALPGPKASSSMWAVSMSSSVCHPSPCGSGTPSACPPTPLLTRSPCTSGCWATGPRSYTTWPASESVVLREPVAAEKLCANPSGCGAPGNISCMLVACWLNCMILFSIGCRTVFLGVERPRQAAEVTRELCCSQQC